MTVRAETDVEEIDGIPFVNTEPLVCALCGQSAPKLGKFAEPAGVGWKDGVNFHPYCRENLRRWGAG